MKDKRGNWGEKKQRYNREMVKREKNYRISERKKSKSRDREMIKKEWGPGNEKERESRKFKSGEI